MDKTQLDGKQLRYWANKIVFPLGVTLMICVMISGLKYKDVFTVPDFRGLIGEFVNLFMSPIVSIVGASNFYLIITAMAIITAIYASLIQKYLIDQTKMIEFNDKMKSFQKEMKEAQKSQNTYMLKRMEEKQAEILKEQSTMMKEQFKPMFYIVIVSIPLWMWANYYIGGHPTASIIFPFWGEQVLGGMLFWAFTYWIYWWILSSLFFSQILRKILNIRTSGM